MSDSTLDAIAAEAGEHGITLSAWDAKMLLVGYLIGRGAPKTLTDTNEARAITRRILVEGAPIEGREKVAHG